MPIPLKFTPPPDKAPQAPTRSVPPAAPKRRSWFGKMFHGAGWLASAPVGWMDTPRIARGGSFIRYLIHALRTPPRRDTRFKTEEQGYFDLRATAFSYGLTVPQLEQRLRARQLQTARVAYGTLILAALFLLAWFWEALSTPLSALRIASALEFLPFVVLFLLLGFYNALLNFQIRTGRTASWREYLATNDAFWPR